MVKSYWDESGINSDSAVCLIAGYFGGINQWRSFEKRWQRIIDREKLPEFHAKRFWARDNGNRVGDYANWDEQRARKFLDDLVDVAIGVDIHPVAMTVVRRDWDTLPEHQRRYITGARYNRATHREATSGSPSQPYFWCFQTCIDAAAKHCRKPLKLHCAFDFNKQLCGHAAVLWQTMKNDPNLPYRHQLGDLMVPRSEETPGLQLADLFAYRSKRYAEKKIKNSQEPVGDLLTKLLSRAISSNEFLLANRKYFENLRGVIPEYLRGNTVE
jgi:hypothetical protein